MNAAISALIGKHLNATLTASEAAALAHALAENSALARDFAAATRMESDLSAAMKEGARTALYTRRMERAAEETEPARTGRPWRVKTMAAAAGIAALIGVGWRLMDVEPDSKTTAKKGSPASPQSVAGGSYASHSSDNRPADASAMKRKLRRFASSTSRLRSVPVSQALAALQAEWKDYAHRDAKDKDAVFILADAARQLWKQPEDEPAVSLEIPGISLLTSLELIAAQAGLKTAITASGVSLEPFPRKDDGKQRTWSIPLSLASVTTFMTRAAEQHQLADSLQRSAGTWFFKPLGNSRRMNPSWMEMPQATAAGWSNYSNSGNIINGKMTAWLDSGLALSAGQPLGSQNTFIADGSGPTVLTLPMAFDAGSAEVLTELDPQIQAYAEARLTNRIPDGTGLVTWDTNTLHDVRWGMETIAETGQAPGSTFKLMAELAAPTASDGYTIDLDLTSEAVEFEGFINYGEPIQTTGVNVLGESEPVILTDSKITQPVFATRVLIDYPANLTRLLAAHGMSAAGATWDQEHGVVLAHGPLSQVRAAQAAAAAVEEAATAGVTVEMKVIEWKDGVPAAAADQSGLLPPPATGQSDTISAQAAFDLLGDPDLERVGDTKGTQQLGMAFTLMAFTLTETKGHEGNIEAGVIADVSGITGSGLSWHLPVKIRRSALTGTTTDDGLTRPARESREHQADLHLQDGEWLRVDIPAHDDAKAITVLLSVMPATVQP